MKLNFPGYKGEALNALQKVKASIGDIIRISKDRKEHNGILIPRSEFDDDKHIIIKLDSGYNVGILIDKNTKIERIGIGEKPQFSKIDSPKQNKDLRHVMILSTGGTIASRVDYRTGGVRPALTANDLYSVVPELSKIAKIETQVLYSVFSEDITTTHWTKIATKTAQSIKNGNSGVVIAHGTDTMGYTAAALSFAIQNTPVPIVLVGSQRSADRPSSDSATNLIGAVKTATNAPFAETVVAMHSTISDDTIVFHRGVKVRKCHTSRRDAFKSINTQPIAKYENGKITMLTKDYHERSSNRKLVVKPVFSKDVSLIKFYPGLNHKIIDWHIKNGYKGLILEGTGLGHIRSDCFKTIQRAVENDIIVGMTSQCIWGRINMNVYQTGRELLEMGVISLHDMLSETALVKLMWILGQTSDTEEAKKMLLSNIANEFSNRTVFE